MVAALRAASGHDRVPGRFESIGAALAAALLLSACTTMGGGTAAAVAVDQGQAAALVNAFRAEHGVRPVSTDGRVVGAAAAGATAMARRNTMSHTTGGKATKRLGATGYSWSIVVENIGDGYGSLGDAMAGWEQSPGHRKNLLNPQVTDLGVAAAATASRGRQRIYWTLVMAAPRDDTRLATLPH
jgi:uncharacterized protein YkwD